MQKLTTLATDSVRGLLALTLHVHVVTCDVHDYMLHNT